MMCESCNLRLSAYLDGELGAAEMRHVGKHLVTCRRCREDLRELEDLKRLLSRLPVHDARGGFWNDALRSVRVRRRRPVAWDYVNAIGAAAAGLAIVAIVMMSRPDRSAPIARTNHIAEMTINPVSLISLHTRERARCPLVDIAKIRIAGSEAEAADLADNGRFDVQ